MSSSETGDEVLPALATASSVAGRSSGLRDSVSSPLAREGQDLPPAPPRLSESRPVGARWWCDDDEHQRCARRTYRLGTRLRRPAASQQLCPQPAGERPGGLVLHRPLGRSSALACLDAEDGESVPCRRAAHGRVCGRPSAGGLALWHENTGWNSWAATMAAWSLPSFCHSSKSSPEPAPGTPASRPALAGTSKRGTRCSEPRPAPAEPLSRRPAPGRAPQPARPADDARAGTVAGERRGRAWAGAAIRRGPVTRTQSPQA